MKFCLTFATWMTCWFLHWRHGQNPHAEECVGILWVFSSTTSEICCMFSYTTIFPGRIDMVCWVWPCSVFAGITEYDASDECFNIGATVSSTSRLVWLVLNTMEQRLCVPHMEHYGPWSNVVHCIGNRAPFRMQAVFPPSALWPIIYVAVRLLNVESTGSNVHLSFGSVLLMGWHGGRVEAFLWSAQSP